MKEEIPGFKPEDGPVSYEQALEAARTLREAGVLDPNLGEYEDPVVQAAWDMVQRWGGEQGLAIARDYTPQKALSIVQAATIWLSAGYNEPEIVKAALEYLQDEQIIAGRQGGDEETIKIIENAIGELEKKLPQKESLSVEIDEKIAIAKKEIESGSKIKAVGMLYNILTHKGYKKKISPELRQELIDLMNKTSKEAGLPVNESFQ